MANSDQFAQLAQNAGITFNSTFIDEIYDIAAEYDSRTKARTQGPAQTRKDLAAVSKSLDATLKGFAKLEPPNTAKLRGVYRSKFLGEHVNRKDRSNSTAPRLADDIVAVKRLSGAISFLLDRLPQSGRPSRESRDMLFVQLAKLYEQRTGMEFHYSDKRDGFVGSDFVRGMAQAIDPDLPDEDFEKGLRACSRIIRSERNLRKTDVGSE